MKYSLVVSVLKKASSFINHQSFISIAQVTGCRQAPCRPDCERAAVRPEEPGRRRDEGVGRHAARPAVLRRQRDGQRLRRRAAALHLEAQRETQLGGRRLEGGRELRDVAAVYGFSL